MCGVIGIIARDKNVGFDLYNGLLDLQHRGQDTAGIFTDDEVSIHLIKGSGRVAEVFNHENLKDLVGSTGVAQVRYPTTKGKHDAQPFYDSTGGIGLAHNGHIVNDSDIREALKDKRIYCDSDCDAETILKTFTYYFNKSAKESTQEKCFDAVEKVMKILLGSYSVIAVIRGKGLFVFRDPHGIRPLVYGKGKNCWAFSSESVAIENIVDEIGDIKPGEAVFIDNELNTDFRLIQPEAPRHCMFEWVYFSRATSIIEGISVNRARGNLGKRLSDIYLESPLHERLKSCTEKIIVAPVPETSRPATVVFAERIGCGYKDVLEKNRFIGRIFIKPSETIRQHEIATNVRAIESVVKDKIVFLVDDSIVRGTTSKGIILKLRKRGAKEVHLFSTCPPLINPCHFGVNFPTKEELISNKTEDSREVAEKIGADSVTYMTVEKLPECLRIPIDQLCIACLGGKNPTPLKKKIIL
ncbi:MAG: amidophosphoribosyltransferase [Caldisericia bacterium]|nr:amidophosphoribosyltransferase [Caldisericia bacterium]